MLIDTILWFYGVLFIICLIMAVLYGSLGLVFSSIGTALIVVSFQPQTESIGGMLRYVSIFPYILSAVFFYRAYINARIQEFYKRSQHEIYIDYPTDPIAVLLTKTINCLKTKIR